MATTFGATVGAYRPYVVTNQVIMVPWYAILQLTAASPALRLLRALNARRPRRRGCCGALGRDLRATPGCCPECGTIAPASAPRAP